MRRVDRTTGRTPVTLQDIADFIGVSKVTVSLALRSDARISADTTRRVCDAARALGYDPSYHKAARALALSKHGQAVLNHVVAVFIHPAFSEYTYHSRIFQGIAKELTAQHFGILTTYPAGVGETPDHLDLPPVFNYGDIDGIIMQDRPAMMTTLLDTLRRNPGFGDRPAVSLIWTVPGTISVRADDEHGGYLAMRHLLEQGHRHIAFLRFSLDPDEPEDRRARGAQRAVAEMAPDAVLLQVTVDQVAWNDDNAPHSESDDAGYTITIDGDWGRPVPELLQRHPEITAIIALNDASAVHCWRILKRNGIDVPGRVSLVGFDDTDCIPDAFGHNILTTVRQPLVEIGREAARQILARLNGDATLPTEDEIDLAPELIVRASTAAPAR